MIIKYYDNHAWGYIDNVRQVVNKSLDTDELIKKYDQEVAKGSKADIASEGAQDSTISDINKVFLQLCDENVDIGDLGNCHSVNLMDPGYFNKNLPVELIVLYLNNHKEYDTLMLVCNQKVFLMNDQGQTIERLA